MLSQYHCYRTFRRSSDTRALEEKVSETDINVINRWEQRGGTSKAKMREPMNQYYAQFELLLKPFLRYTYAMWENTQRRKSMVRTIRGKDEKDQRGGKLIHERTRRFYGWSRSSSFSEAWRDSFYEGFRLLCLVCLFLDICFSKRGEIPWENI